MAIAERTLPTREMALAVNREKIGKLFFCVMECLNKSPPMTAA
jgi:hypothetical protein